MPLIRAPYDPTVGPLIEAEVLYPIALWPVSGVRPSASLTFMIDTGASNTHIPAVIASHLAIAPIGQRQVKYGNGVIETVEIYPIDIIFPTVGYEIRDLQAREYKSKYIKYDALLGRDVLQHCSLRLYARQGELFLVF
jgi:predicted aspartyl protease